MGSLLGPRDTYGAGIACNALLFDNTSQRTKATIKGNGGILSNPVWSVAPAKTEKKKDGAINEDKENDPKNGNLSKKRDTKAAEKADGSLNQTVSATPGE